MNKAKDNETINQVIHTEISFEAKALADTWLDKFLNLLHT